ncbi:serine/threonine-protein kinase [Planctomicrobium piriforme]|uniref:non-specific serine/threonine protein kinase n=1 Tax=Planctomicrobium piriforme TaxID=1576369 RepID=A0A1I3P6B2_9PLAN|nr:serine/threonine-protein kinase [Planctomicrobium piriforme]SFJ17095.1 Serine/threonine protein kinase [Planctomicrobium piriforme]
MQHEELLEKIFAKPIGGCKAIRYIARGASALVFEAQYDGQRIALKVFDPDFLNDNDSQEQIERINRQLLLCDLSHPHLINIREGGQCKDTGFYFLSMDFLDAPSLDKVIAEIPADRISDIIRQVASAAFFLEGHKLVHRDIKPANISLSDDFQTATLLDLGVVRPVGLSELTDTPTERPFVGTKRYSPPEFLTRKEDDSLDSWRAITFYQLGAVLFDMITRRPLFAGITPKDRLTEHILLKTPSIDCTDDIPESLKQLTQFALIKDPEVRLAMVTWSSFGITESVRPSLTELRSRISTLRPAASNKLSPPSSALPGSAVSLHRHWCKQLVVHLKSQCVDNTLGLPPHMIDIYDEQSPGHVDIKLTLFASKEHGTPANCELFIRSELKDAAAGLVTIAIAAHGPSHMAATSVESAKWNTVYRGSQSDEAIEPIICGICEFFVHALASVSANGDMGVSTIHWATVTRV